MVIRGVWEEKNPWGMNRRNNSFTKKKKMNRELAWRESLWHSVGEKRLVKYGT